MFLLHRKIIQALLTFALATPAFARFLGSDAENTGCYGGVEDGMLAGAAAIVIPAVTGLLVNKDTSVIDKYFSDNYTQHNPDFPDGKETLFALAELSFEYTPGRIVAQGDLVTIHARLTGVGPVPLIVMDLFRVEGGLIVEHWDVIQPEVPANETVSGNPMWTPAP
jgi:predicted SnoaL-like aldol condensation-catalyzing enzyme